MKAALLFLLLAPLALRAAAEPPPDAAWPATLRYAQQAGWAARGAMSLVITARAGGEPRQWLVGLAPAPLSAEERRERPAISDLVRYTTTGRVLRFSDQASVAIEVRIAGPFTSAETAAGPPPADRRRRVLANAAFLHAGLDETCRTWLRLRAALAERRALHPAAAPVNLDLSCSPRPYPPAVTAAARDDADLIPVTPEDERRLFGAEVALESFWKIVESLPEAGAVLGPIESAPSFWARLRHLGEEPVLFLQPTEIRALPTAEAYAAPFRLVRGQDVVLTGELTVVPPAAGTWATAGIVAAEIRSQADPSRRLWLKALSLSSP